MRMVQNKIFGNVADERIGYDRAACVSSLTKGFENHLTVFV